MKLIKVALNKISNNHLEIIYEHDRWYAFKVNYRTLFYIVFAILFALVAKLMIKDYPDPQPQEVIEHLIYRV